MAPANGLPAMLLNGFLSISHSGGVLVVGWSDGVGVPVPVLMDANDASAASKSPGDAKDASAGAARAGDAAALVAASAVAAGVSASSRSPRTLMTVGVENTKWRAGVAAGACDGSDWPAAPADVDFLSGVPNVLPSGPASGLLLSPWSS